MHLLFRLSLVVCDGDCFLAALKIIYAERFTQLLLLGLS
jgi:hypothetical protein